MSKISSTTLFHFLKKREWLFEIIQNLKMYPRYVLEEFPPINEKYLISMKCFCDIPLSNITNHTKTYGKFGIGLSKEFAFRNYISPVQYFHDASDPMFALMSIDFKEERDFVFLLPYFKYMYSSDRKTNYYEEREWRYVYREFVEVTNNSKSQIEELKYDLNTIKSKKIPFKLDEIEYIIVENKNDVLKLINEIEKMHFKRIEKNILISKVITTEQIENDF